MMSRMRLLPVRDGATSRPEVRGRWLLLVCPERPLSTTTAICGVIAHEAVRTRPFYLAGLGEPMPAAELRALILQLAVAATVLSGFADTRTKMTIGSHARFTVFCTRWVLWLLVGFLPLDELVHPVDQSRRLASSLACYMRSPSIRDTRNWEPAAAEIRCCSC